MPRTTARPKPTEHETLRCLQTACASCGQPMRYAYDNWRSVSLLNGRVVRLRLKIRRCEHADCERYKRPYRPEAEGHWALPEHEFGLEVIALVGQLRYREHRSVAEIHQALRDRQVTISERTVTHLLARYDELVAVSLLDNRRLQQVLAQQTRVVIAVDGLQPDVGHEVLWVVRDCLSGEVLLARSLLSATADDLAALLGEVQTGLPRRVAVAGVISDGQRSLRKAVARVWPNVPHQLCQFHYLREAALPIYEADRHAKKELKKRVRGVRPLERAVEGQTDATAQVVRDYCGAVRSALTDDGRPPLSASGLRLHERLTAIAHSLERAAKKGASCPSRW